MKTKRTVKTKEELKKAKEDGVDIITVKGELANNLFVSYEVSTIAPATVGILTGLLTAATFTAPITGGLSYAAAAPVAGATGLSVGVIIAIVAAGGIILVLAICKEYDIEYSHKDAKGNVDELKIKKHE